MKQRSSFFKLFLGNLALILIMAIVAVAMPIKDIVEQGTVLPQTLLLAAVASGVAALVLGLLVSWTWYAPLRRISATARKIAQGDLNARALTTGPSELAQLGKSLNEMRDSLAEKIQALSAQRGNLQTVVANLREGVVALDGQGMIVLMNQAACRMMGRDVQTPEGKHLQTVIRSADVMDAYAQAMRTGRPAERQIELPGATGKVMLDVHARRVEGGESRKISGIIVVRDVTDLARSAAMKAEFVANASHELRTPLATIRAAVETLMSAQDDPETFHKCADILSRHVARLENMTNDLLDLHTVESGRIRLELEEIIPEGLKQWAQGQFAPRAGEKSLEFHVEADGPNGQFRSDRKLLELILGNLLDNAIKYTPAGGRVDCAIRPQARGLVLKVSDTGCGIRSQDQPRVFERFFQADAARSGDTKIRGTGLGLAIVKHAAERLGGSITLESELGKGTTVTVSLPSALCGGT